MQETPADSWVGKIPWRRERLPTPVFRPRKLHGMGSQKVRHDWVTFTFIYHLSPVKINESFSTYLTASFVQLLSCVWLWDPMNSMQQARLPRPSLSPGVCSNSCPLSWWCHPTISSSVDPFSSHTQIFPSIRVFSNELVLRIRRQSTGDSAPASVLPVNIQGWFPSGLTGLISLHPYEDQKIIQPKYLAHCAY